MAEQDVRAAKRQEVALVRMEKKHACEVEVEVDKATVSLKAEVTKKERIVRRTEADVKIAHKGLQEVKADPKPHPNPNPNPYPYPNPNHNPQPINPNLTCFHFLFLTRRAAGLSCVECDAYMSCMNMLIILSPAAVHQTRVRLLMFL